MYVYVYIYIMHATHAIYVSKYKDIFLLMLRYMYLNFHYIKKGKKVKVNYLQDSRLYSMVHLHLVIIRIYLVRFSLFKVTHLISEFKLVENKTIEKPQSK
jgi:hypothetical protein